MRSSRTRRRSAERGAALFIVVMVVVLLSAIGVFAVRTSSLVEVASGFSRRAEQATYLSEFGLRSVAGDMPGKEDLYRKCIAAGAQECRANRNLSTFLPAGATAPCCAKEGPEILQALADAVSAEPIATDPDGLFGNVIRPGQESTVRAAFRVEMTDLGPAPDQKAGEDLSESHFSIQQTTFTATGMIQPTPAGTACTEDVAQASGVASLRAHVTFLTTK